MISRIFVHSFQPSSVISKVNFNSRQKIIQSSLFHLNTRGTGSPIRRNTSERITSRMSKSSSFVEFLSKTHYDNHDNVKNNPKLVVMGNEAGDADSILSALALSFVLDQQRGSYSDESSAVIPLVSIPKEDLSLRPDVVLLLKAANIDSEKLFYLSDNLSLQNLFQSSQPSKDRPASEEWVQNLSICLTDHNSIRYNLSHLRDNVCLIVDHHQDEENHPKVTGTSRDIAFRDGKATVGSTCTLVTERLFQLRNNTSETKNIDANLALILLGTIILDTVNMDPTSGKGTERDKAAIEKLLECTDWFSLHHTHPNLFSLKKENEKLKPCPSHIFKWLSEAKFDSKFWMGMSAFDALRIDYKRFEKSSSLEEEEALLQKNLAFGLSSVLIPIHDMIQKPQFISDTQLFMSNNHAKVTLLGILSCVFNSSGPEREMLLIGTSERVNSMTDFLLNDPSTASLQFSLPDEEKEKAFMNVIEKSGHNFDMNVKLLLQKNPKASRKQVAPVMMASSL